MVCYLERGPGGSTLRRVRMVGAAFDRSWTAPVAGEIGSGSGGSEGAQAVSAVRSGAKWVADTLKGLGTSRLDVLCLDGEGGVCTWLSAASAAPGVIRATIQQSVLSGGDSAGGSAGRLIAAGIASGAQGGGGGLESDVSVQALAVAEDDESKMNGASGLRGALARRGGARVQSGGTRERFAVLSMRDAPVRVFIDELDARGIEVGSVESIWHALAATWDPGAVRPGEEGPDAGPAQLSAVVMTDPAGRLVWSWSAGGELLAAGQVRLRHVVRRDERESGAAQSGAELAVVDSGATRRIEEESVGVEGLECTGAEVGRIVMDWLAWSAQLGRSPQRVLCFGPLTLPDPGNGTTQWLGGPSPASLAEGLGRAWRGATIDAAAHEDPIGATLARLAGVGPLGARPARSGSGGGGDGKAEGDDPRRELLGLGARPGRVDRRMYHSMAIGLAAAALVVGVAGWQFHRAAGGATDEIEQARDRRADALKTMEAIIPNLTKHPDPVGVLSAKINELEQLNKSLKPQRPILQEMARILRAIEGAADTRIKELTITGAVASVRLVVPDSETGPAVLERLSAIPGGIPWRGATPPVQGSERLYVLTGTWPMEAAPPPAARGTAP